LISRFSIASGFAVLLQLSAVATSTAQQQYKTSPIIDYKPAVGRCLTPEQKKVNDAYNSLSRPTQPGDDQPFWDPEYLVGAWDVDIRSQESPLGAGGQSTATMTIKGNAKDPCLYEGSLKGEDSDGKAFTRTITASYDPVKKILTWTEKDSRGYTIVKRGPIGGELGGLFHHHFGEDENAPVTTFGGKKFKIKGVSEMSSPAFFKSDLQVSIDGAPFKMLGRIQFEKQLPPDAK
jgi:hypothetical protein